MLKLVHVLADESELARIDRVGRATARLIAWSVEEAPECHNVSKMT